MGRTDTGFMDRIVQTVAGICLVLNLLVHFIAAREVVSEMPAFYIVLVGASVLAFGSGSLLYSMVWGNGNV